MSGRYLRDLIRLVDRCTYDDSYGVYGSDFTVCRICERESGAGMLARPNWHATDCPVPRIQRKVQNRGQASKGATP